MVIKDEENTEVLNTFFVPVFNNKTGCPQDNWPSELVDGLREQNSPPVIQEEAVTDLLSYLAAHKSMGPDGIHPRGMRELAEELTKLISIIYHQSWLAMEVPDNWKLATVTPIQNKGQNHKIFSLTSVPGKIMKQIILSAITWHPQDG
ncbi:hypothetical protein HGM15179_018847 [Zosterops borbonicus]|uniref:RNA-directed DNA polymerase from mobile element jockey n=1 Tax=Zosterops borbonicus TaxID=364589 RepID=A0A8K1FYD9_9PASS|nr:hypothetical protein HGM15179_018847 [Zosterops borbonicus]